MPFRSFLFSFFTVLFYDFAELWKPVFFYVPRTDREPYQALFSHQVTNCRLNASVADACLQADVVTTGDAKLLNGVDNVVLPAARVFRNMPFWIVIIDRHIPAHPVVLIF